MLAIENSCLRIVVLALFSFAGQLAGQEWEHSGQIKAPEAHQAAAADHEFVYAITNQRVAKYDRESGERVAVSRGKAGHLNSGFLWEGNLYCARLELSQRTGAKPNQAA